MQIVAPEYQGEWMHLGLDICKGKFAALHTPPSPSLLKVQGGKSLGLDTDYRGWDIQGKKAKERKK